MGFYHKNVEEKQTNEQFWDAIIKYHSAVTKKLSYKQGLMFLVLKAFKHPHSYHPRDKCLNSIQHNLSFISSVVVNVQCL